MRQIPLIPFSLSQLETETAISDISLHYIEENT
jgi:hypothetical protein